MDSMTISFDIKGMINGKYIIAASAIAISVTYVATSARELISKWLESRSQRSQKFVHVDETIQSKSPQSNISSTIIEDYKVNMQ